MSECRYRYTAAVGALMSSYRVGADQRRAAMRKEEERKDNWTHGKWHVGWARRGAAKWTEECAECTRCESRSRNLPAPADRRLTLRIALQAPRCSRRRRSG